MSAGSSKLQHALKDLRAHWDETKSLWSDQVARDFEKNHLAPLDQQTTIAMRGMAEIAEVLNRVRHECSSNE